MHERGRHLVAGREDEKTLTAINIGWKQFRVCKIKVCDLYCLKNIMTPRNEIPNSPARQRDRSQKI